MAPQFFGNVNQTRFGKANTSKPNLKLNPGLYSHPGNSNLQPVKCDRCIYIQELTNDYISFSERSEDSPARRKEDT